VPRCPTHLFLLDLVEQMVFGEEYRLETPHCWIFLQSPVTCAVFGAKVFQSTLFSDTFSLCFGLSVRGQVTLSCRRTRFIVLLLVTEAVTRASQ
jgi:hypothetical protein